MFQAHQAVYPLPHHALYWEAFVAVWIFIQIATGTLLYKSFRARRADDPKTFWAGIMVQFLPLAGCFCASMSFAPGMYFVALLSVAIVLVTIFHFIWIGFRDIKRLFCGIFSAKATRSNEV